MPGSNCPRCGSPDAYRSPFSGDWVCGLCRRRATVRDLRRHLRAAGFGDLASEEPSSGLLADLRWHAAHADPCEGVVSALLALQALLSPSLDSEDPGGLTRPASPYSSGTEHDNPQLW